MNPILAALEQAAAQLLQSAFNAVMPVVVNWLIGQFQKQAKLNHSLQALTKEQYRSTARQWVKDALTELGNAVAAKNVLPAFVVPFLPLLEAGLEQAIEAGLDAAGL